MEREVGRTDEERCGMHVCRGMLGVYGTLGYVLGYRISHMPERVYDVSSVRGYNPTL